MIREAKLKDMEACIEIQDSLFGEDREMPGYYFKKNIKDKDFTILIAESEGRIAGFTTFEYRRWNNTIYVYTMYIVKESQSKGIGSKLLSEIIKRAKDLKARKIFLDTKGTNKKAIDFYKKKGFQKAGSINDYYKDGKCRDALILSLDLNQT